MRQKLLFTLLVFTVFNARVLAGPAVCQMIACNGGYAVGALDGGAIMEVNPQTAVSTVIGFPIPAESLTGIDFTSAGTLFGFNDDGDLIIIDPTNGSLINNIGQVTLSGAPVQLVDMAIQPSTDIIYGVTTTNKLVTVNSSTAVATLIGQFSGSFTSIAFAPNGTLYGLQMNSNIGLLTINPTNAAILSNTVLSLPIGVMGLGFNPADGLLYGSECCIGSIGNNLYTITTTGTTTLVGSLGGSRRVHDFAFINCNPPTSIPTFNEWGLICLLGLFVIAGIFLIKKA